MSMNMEEIRERSVEAYREMLSSEVLDAIARSASDVPYLLTQNKVLKMQLRRAKQSADNFAADAAYWHSRYTYTLGLD